MEILSIVIPGDRLNYIFIEINKFSKSIDDIEDGNLEDYFYFCLKSLSELEEQPQKLKGGVFDTIFSSARLSTLNSKEYHQYRKAMFTEIDRRSLLLSSRQEGREEGLQEGIKRKSCEIAKTMLTKGYSKQEISEIIGMTIEDVEALMS